MNKKYLIFRVFIFSLIFSILSPVYVYAETVELLKQNYYENEKQINALNAQIKLRQSEIDNLKKQTQKYDNIIAEKQKESLTLVNQISILDTKVAKSELEVRKIDREKETLDAQMAQINEEIKLKELKISNEKGNLANLIQQIHEKDNKNILNVLIVNNSLSDFFNEVQYLEELQNTLVYTLNDIKIFKNEFEVSKVEMEEKKFELKELQIEQESKIAMLEEEKQAREIILEETNNSEQKFQQMLNMVRAEKSNADKEMKVLENEVKTQLSKHKFDFTIDPNKIQLVWPVPLQGITVYFHDPTYLFKRWVGEHSGIDLRTLINGRPSNGVPVRATTSGMVIKTIKNGRYAGNAVYIAHSDNVMSVYFHLSEIKVKEEEFVPIGSVIGLGGGMPGTYGAGLSTGPHLHFEVRIDGIPVDPLEYLP